LELLRAWSSSWNDFIFGVDWGKCVRLMKLFLALILWCLLLVACWPLAVLALVLFPFLWVLSLPLRLFAIVVAAAFALIKAILFFPSRILGSRN
jgi:hypothetical protein